jgi:hypothetical protein
MFLWNSQVSVVSYLRIEFTLGDHRLSNVHRPRMSICILADTADIDRAKQIELEYMSVDYLKKCVDLVIFHPAVTHIGRI